jgi:hypothetical protein
VKDHRVIVDEDEDEDGELSTPTLVDAKPLYLFLAPSILVYQSSIDLA